MCCCYCKKRTCCYTIGFLGLVVSLWICVKFDVKSWDNFQRPFWAFYPKSLVKYQEILDSDKVKNMTVRFVCIFHFIINLILIFGIRNKFKWCLSTWIYGYGLLAILTLNEFLLLILFNNNHKIMANLFRIILISKYIFTTEGMHLLFKKNFQNIQ